MTQQEQATSPPHVREISLRKPDDWHVHLRDAAMLQSVVGATSATLQPRDRDAEPGAAGGRIKALLPKPIGSAFSIAVRCRVRVNTERFEPLMTLYLTDETLAVDGCRCRGLPGWSPR